MAMSYQEVVQLKKLLAAERRTLKRLVQKLDDAELDTRSTPLYIEHCRKERDRGVRAVSRLEALLRESWSADPGARAGES